MNRDEIFKQAQSSPRPFEFNQEVASVFDDMVNRSIPFYQEIHSMILGLLTRFCPHEKIKIVDIGCSTGTTLKLIHEHLKGQQRNHELIGIDLSSAMIEAAEKKLALAGVDNVKLFQGDILDIEFGQADFIIMNYTLQFINMLERPNVIEKIYHHLRPNGGQFILSEKIRTNNPIFEELFTQHYYDFKRNNGYSELEISQKREALETVLVPLTPAQQLESLKEAGFKNVEMLFRWYNFASFLGVKGHVAANLKPNIYH